MKHLPIPRDWQETADHYFETLHRLASGERSEIVLRKVNTFAGRLKMKYREDVCYEFFMWRVLLLKNLSSYRDSSDIPTALDFEGKDSVARFIDGLAREYLPHETSLKTRS